MKSPLRTPALALGLLAAPLGLLAACGDGDTPDTFDAQACVQQSFAAQSTHRFAVGSTFYLPQLDAGDQACAELAWTLTSAPSTNANELIEGADGIARFTPHVAGDYTFEAAEDLQVTLTVIASDQVPFHNLNLFPTRSLEPADGEVWVANVMTPTVAVLDAETLTTKNEIAVGMWPVAVAHVPNTKLTVVAQRGGDTLGFVDRDAGHIVDAVWVGDEPANVVVHPDGTRAFVSLPYQAAVAVVDIEKRELVDTIDANFDASALALSPSGDRLYVASRRSGQPERFPYGDDPLALENDIVAIDTESLDVVTEFVDIGTTIGGLLVSADGTTLWASSLRNDPSVSLAAEDEPSFIYEVRAFNAMTGDAIASADLSRQSTSAGPVVTPGAMVEADGLLWVVSEGSDALLALDPETLEEQLRSDVPGRPRALTTDGLRLFAHGHQATQVSAFDFDGTPAAEGSSGVDPRPEAVVIGQAFFTGQGRTYGTTWSCNSCHTDGLTDTLVWNAGPVENRVVPRPFFWAQGTTPLGWAGYLSTIENYAYTVTGNVGIRPTTEEATTLGAYLASIMPPAAANHLTERDGSMSAVALEAEQLYAEACSSCHPLPLTTSKRSLAEGITPGLSDIPALVGAYRHGAWLKTGEATSLRDAVAAAADAFVDRGVSDDEIDAITRYVQELTGRDFFALRSYPAEDESAFGIDQTMTIDFSLPIWEASENLANIQLVDASGATVDTTITVDAADPRHVTIQPATSLAFDADYELIIGADTQAWNERPVFAERRVLFSTAKEPEFTLDGDFEFVVQAPTLNPIEQTWDTSNTTISRSRVTATPTPSGADLVVDYGLDLEAELHVVINGGALVLPPLPVAIGPSFADFRPQAALFDAEGGELRAEGKGGFSGPGFVFDDIAWELKPPTPPGECDEGSEGVLEVTYSVDENGRMIFDWGTDDPAIAAWVTDPAANIPAGPNPVTGGETYWYINSPTAPDDGFAGPVTYGVTPDGAVEDTAFHGGEFKNLVVGQCYKVSVATTAFELGGRIFRWDP